MKTCGLERSMPCERPSSSTWSMRARCRWTLPTAVFNPVSIPTVSCFPRRLVLPRGTAWFCPRTETLPRPSFPLTSVLGNLFFAISPGDTMKVLDPSLAALTSRLNRAYGKIHLPSPAIVMNEINYHSRDDLDTGDWVELYNSGDYPADLSVGPFQGWKRPAFLRVARSHSSTAPGIPGVVSGSEGLGTHLPGPLYRRLRLRIEEQRRADCLYDRHGLLSIRSSMGIVHRGRKRQDGDGPTLELRHHDLDNATPRAGWPPSLRGGPRARSTVPRTLTVRCPSLSRSRLPIRSPTRSPSTSTSAGMRRSPLRSITPLASVRKFWSTGSSPPDVAISPGPPGRGGWCLPLRP